MSFQSLSFLAFLAVTLGACLPTARKNVQAGRLFLGLASLVFYLWGFRADSRVFYVLFILLWGQGVTLLAARRMISGRRGRRGALTAAVCWHVLVLLIFKYADFFTGGACSIGWAPLGLSFFTFQQIWFLKKVFTNEIPGVQIERLNPMDFQLFSLFFPTVASGPILRPEDFFPQLEGRGFLRPGWDGAAAGLYAIARGTVKKVLLADALGAVADAGWAQIPALTAPGAWLVILSYTLQLYLDFSGYCDIAAGAARLLGIRLPVNFDSPYRALSVGEFWRRWHITLTSFLRECVYFPLGGSRRGRLRAYGNILIVFLVSGLWHGAGWTFLLWGALHGLAQVLERLWGKGRERLPKAVRWCLTFGFVNFAWVFFRAPDLPAAAALLKRAVLGGIARPEAWLFAGVLPSETRALAALAPGLESAAPLALTAAVYALGLWAALTEKNTIRQMDAFRPTLWRAAALALATAWSILSFTGISSFIYSNF